MATNSGLIANIVLPKAKEESDEKKANGVNVEHEQNEELKNNGLIQTLRDIQCCGKSCGEVCDKICETWKVKGNKSSTTGVIRNQYEIRQITIKRPASFESLASQNPDQNDNSLNQNGTKENEGPTEMNEFRKRASSFRDQFSSFSSQVSDVFDIPNQLTRSGSDSHANPNGPLNNKQSTNKFTVSQKAVSLKGRNEMSSYRPLSNPAPNGQRFMMVTPSPFGNDNPIKSPIDPSKEITFWAAENIQPRTKIKLSTDNDIGSIRPELYMKDNKEMTDEQLEEKYKLGVIEFNLKYDLTKKQFTAHVICGMNLPHPSTKNKEDQANSNAYCKMFLCQNDSDTCAEKLPRRHGRNTEETGFKRTSIKRKTQNPVWGEVFTFDNISLRELQQRTFLILVKDFDNFTRHRTIGEVRVRLQGVNLIRGQLFRKPLIPTASNDSIEMGELLISLNYLPAAGRLIIDILKAKNLLHTHEDIDSLVRVDLIYYDKVIKTKKTSIKKHALEPVFNESLQFNIAHEQLAECTVVLTMTGKHQSRSCTIGRVLLGKYNSDIDADSHWSQILTGQKSPGAVWHFLHSKEFCDKLLPANISVP